jgi:hypothetical protein
MAEQLIHRGTLEGHSGWVTSLATSLEKYDFYNRRACKSDIDIALICFSLDLETNL